MNTEIDPAELAAKRAAGLTAEQAREVILAQRAHDETDPHDPPPAPEPEPKPKGKKAKVEPEA